MAIVEHSASLNFAQCDIYDIINDIEHYSTFLKDCKQSLILDRGRDYLKGKLVLERSGLQISFTTLNTMTPNDKVTMKLLDGPFSKFEGVWLLTAKGAKQTDVQFRLEYETSNLFIKIASAKVLQNLPSELIEAFEQQLALK